MKAPVIALLLKRRHWRKQRAQRRFSIRSRSWGLAGILTLSLAVVILTVGGAFFLAWLTNGLPSLQQLPLLMNPQDGLLLQPTRFYDHSGRHLLYTLENAGIQRRFLSIDPQQEDHFSPLLIQSVVALIEPDFWQSPGFSWEHLTGQQPQTIAEKLVDSLLLANEPGGLRRALRMRLLAAQLVAEYGRSQVLEWYLNSVSFGHHSYGADSASLLYLGKPASDLSLAESALLVALIRAPALNPIDASAAALQGQEDALQDLRSSGIFSRELLDQAAQEKIVFPASVEKTPEIPAFTRLVLEQLTQFLPLEVIERGGLHILTTLDMDLQNELLCTMRTQLARLEGEDKAAGSCQAANLLPTLPSLDEPLSSALMAGGVILDPQTGQVLAMTGSQDLNGDLFQTLRYEPGSLLTPFVATVAFGRGFSPASLVWDVSSASSGYSNPDGKEHGPLRLRQAIANDTLLPISRILTQIGPPVCMAVGRTA